MFGLALNAATLKAKLGLAVAAIAVAALICALFFHFGKREGRSELQAETLRRALSRIQTMEKNDAGFRDLSGRDRCLMLVRDSGLPDGSCD